MHFLSKRSTKSILGIVLLIAFLACFRIGLEVGDPDNPNSINQAEAELRTARSQLAIVNKTTDIAGKATLLIPDERKEVATPVLSSLRNAHNQAAFDVVLANKKLEQARLDQSKLVVLVSCTNRDEFHKLFPALVASRIPYRLTEDLVVWVRDEDSEAARKSVGLAPIHGYK